MGLKEWIDWPGRDTAAQNQIFYIKNTMNLIWQHVQGGSLIVLCKVKYHTNWCYGIQLSRQRLRYSNFSHVAAPPLLWFRHSTEGLMHFDNAPMSKCTTQAKIRSYLPETMRHLPNKFISGKNLSTESVLYLTSASWSCCLVSRTAQRHAKGMQSG